MLLAINKLKEFNIDLSNIVKNYELSDVTKIENETLYYKSIPEGLFLLAHEGRVTTLNNHFDNFGTMLDLARGAVFTVNYLKELVYKQALMGVNQIWLYLEDVFELPEYPTFGYFRGKYKKEELREVVEFAKIFGVEIIPSIQVLGHHEQFLRWPNSLPFRDQDRVLLVETELTYELIRKMIDWCKDVFTTDKIHVGMDETFGLGFGAYYKHNGYKKPLDIFVDHLNFVNNYCIKQGYKEVMIWSDMFFRLHSKHDYYYDASIVLKDELVAKIPNNVTLVYWDYYNHNNELVSAMIKNHIKTNRKSVFASGTWIWTRLNYDHKKTKDTAFMHLDESIKNGLKDFILTQWMDDGAYGDHITTLLGVYDLAVKAMDLEVDTKAYKLITNEEYNNGHLKTLINNTEMFQVGLLWDDPILGIYTVNFVGNDLNNYAKYLTEQKELFEKYDQSNKFEYLISKINYLKLQIRYEILRDYQNKDIKQDVLDKIDEAIKSLNELNDWYINMWTSRYRLYGLEVIQNRLGTQIIRFQTLAKLVKNYKKGDVIDVFEEKAIMGQYLSLKYDNIAFSVKSV